MAIRYLILFSVVVLGCNSFRPATYALTIKGATIKLNLKSDSTFEYFSRHELAETISAGTWSFYNDTVRLLSNDSFGSMNGKVKEMEADQSFFEFKFLDVECLEPYANLEVLLNGLKKMTTDVNGIMVISEPVKTIDLMVLDTYPFHYRVKDSNARKFEVCLTMVSLREKYFINEPFKFKSGKLIDRYGIVLKRERD